jgi:hypothetical protein
MLNENATKLSPAGGEGKLVGDPGGVGGVGKLVDDPGVEGSRSWWKPNEGGRIGEWGSWGELDAVGGWTMAAGFQIY